VRGFISHQRLGPVGDDPSGQVRNAATRAY
jgi:hypothetical protein